MSHICVSALLCASLVVPAASQTVLRDEEFFIQDPLTNEDLWTAQQLTEIQPNKAGKVTRAQIERRSTGGNPGAYRHVTFLDPQNGTIGTFHYWEAGVYNPSVQGAILTLDYSFDIQGPPQAQMSYLFLARQGNNVYLDFPGHRSPDDGSWATVGGQARTAENLLLFMGSGPSRPDFSASGEPIVFGYYLTSPIVPSAETKLDNFEVVIYSPCEDISALPGGFYDGDFLDTEWQLLPEIDPLDNSSVTATRVANGGNPGAYRRIDNLLGNAPSGMESAIYSVHLLQGAIYNPSASGPIESIDYCEEAIAIVSTHRQATGPAIRQDGKLYIRNAGVTLDALFWHSIRATNLMATNFVELLTAPGAIPYIDANSHPDFSGSTMEYGFYRANSTRSSGGARNAGIDNWSLLVHRRETPMFTSVSAANYMSPVAPEMLVSGYGEEDKNLVETTEVALEVPLPTVLQGVSVRVTDIQGVARLAELIFVARGQINYIMPAEVALGNALVEVVNQQGLVLASGAVEIARIAPGLFTANSDGQGAAAAIALRATGNETLSQVIFACGIVIGSCEPRPIEMGSASDQVFLILFGTGIRGRNDLSDIEVTIDGVPIAVGYGGAQNEFPALDQINAGPIPRSLLGRGVLNVVVKVEGLQANTVTIRID